MLESKNSKEAKGSIESNDAIEASGVYLRPITEEDGELIITWRNQDHVRKHFIYQDIFTKESQKIWMDTMVKTGKVVQMMICLEEDDTCIGSVYLRDIDLTHQKAEYGIFIGEECCRGKGYGTEAAELMIWYAFEELKLHKVFLRVYAENKAAIKSYEKAGFVQEAYLKEDVCIEGNYKDMIFMAIINTEE